MRACYGRREEVKLLETFATKYRCQDPMCTELFGDHTHTANWARIQRDNNREVVVPRFTVRRYIEQVEVVGGVL